MTEHDYNDSFGLNHGFSWVGENAKLNQIRAVVHERSIIRYFIYLLIFVVTLLVCPIVTKACRMVSDEIWKILICITIYIDNLSIF